MSADTTLESADRVLDVPAGVAPAAPLSGALLRRQIMQYAPAVLLPAVMSIVSAAVFTRVFDAAQYGRFTLAWSVGTVVILLASQWLQQGITRFLPAAAPGDDTHRIKGDIALALLVVLAVTIIVGTAAALLGRLMLPPPWPRDVLGAAAMIAATSLFAPTAAVIQSEMRASRYSAYLVATSVLRLAIGLLLVFRVARDPASLLWAQAGAVLIVMPALWRDARLPTMSNVLAHWRARWADIRTIAAYGFPVVGFTIAGTLLDVSDRWVIQFFRGTSAAGIYAANYSLVVGTIGLVALPMQLAAHPFLMRAWAGGDRPAAARWLGLIVEWYVIAGTLLVGVIALYARDIASVMLGPSFHEGYRIIPIVLAGMIAWQLGVYSHKPLEFAHRTGTMFRLCAGVTVLNLLANLVVVPRFGYMGAAYTSLVSYLLYTLIATWIGRRILAWGIRWRRVLASLALTVAGLLITAAVRAAVQPSVGYLVALLASLAIAAATAALVLGREVLPMIRSSRNAREHTASR